jgi:adenylate cyclase
MHVAYTYKNILQEEMFLGDEILIGRHEGDVDVGLELNFRFDRLVSHRHARIWVKDGACWIEDLGSRNGTLVNGFAMEPRSARIIRADDEISIGETKVHVDVSTDAIDRREASNITLTLDAVKPVYKSEGYSYPDADHRLAILYELPLKFGSEIQLDDLLGIIVQRLMEAVSGSARAALVLSDPATNALLLKAHLPTGRPCVSMTLARRALKEQVAFVWQRQDKNELKATRALDDVDCAMYAPLLWKGNALGVVCLDNYGRARIFDNDDLRLLVAIAQHAAMAVANQLLQEQLRRESAAKANLLRQFSPQIAERLRKDQAPVAAGGERSYVTILFADIRGFSRLTRSIGPESLVELLNSYFAAMTSVVFSHDGTVVQYVGDTIFAVFGSPEADPEHYEKALRAAIAMQEKMSSFNSVREQDGKTTCHFGIGVHCGEVVHGFIGGPDCLLFAVLGDPVNRTARYCAAAKSGEVLISPDLYERVWRIVRDAESLTVDAKFEEHLPAYRVRSLWEQ